jgi:hypothetical protein
LQKAEALGRKVQFAYQSRPPREADELGRELVKNRPWSMYPPIAAIAANLEEDCRATLDDDEARAAERISESSS